MFAVVSGDEVVRCICPVVRAPVVRASVVE
jgi:hypothetical protein